MCNTLIYKDGDYYFVFKLIANFAKLSTRNQKLPYV